MEIDLKAHAYLVRGSGGSAQLLEILHAHGIETRGNPDCMVRECDELSVADARDISSFAYYKPIGEKKFVVISAKSMTREAQNALLKIVEEGSGQTVFFFVLERGASVLPTLESRCVVIKNSVADGIQKVGEEFLSMNYKDRLELAEKFTKDHDREGARQLVRSLIALADTKKFESKVLRDLLDADQYLKLSGSSPKGVIGHLALIL